MCRDDSKLSQVIGDVLYTLLHEDVWDLFFQPACPADHTTRLLSELQARSYLAVLGRTTAAESVVVETAQGDGMPVNGAAA